MKDPYVTLIALGAVAVSSGLVMFTFDIISISLYRNPVSKKPELTALFSSTLQGTTLVLLAILLGQRFIHRRRSYYHHYRPEGCLIALASISCILSSVITTLELCLIKKRSFDNSEWSALRQKHSLLMGAFIFGIISIVSQLAFIIYLFSLRKRKTINSEDHTLKESQESTKTPESVQFRPSSSLHVKHNFSGNPSPTNSGSSLAKFHSNRISEIKWLMQSAVFSLRSRLKNAHQEEQLSCQNYTKSQASHTPPSVHDGFDVWETSSIESQTRRTVDSIPSTSLLCKHSQSSRFLETIPASPTETVELSSNLTKNLQPVKPKEVLRSFSPSTGYREKRRYSRSITPVDGNDESHIHPLFRTDSVNPPPAATPGTIVTAAPGAGQVISDRSLKSKRSGSSLKIHCANPNNIEIASKITETEQRGRLLRNCQPSVRPTITTFDGEAPAVEVSTKQTKEN